MTFPNFCRLILLSLSFLTLFTAFNISQNVASKIMKDLGFTRLGFVNLSVVYILYSISSLFAVKINRLLGTRLTLVLSALTYATWIAAHLLPVYRLEYQIETGICSDESITVISIVTAALLGIGAGPLWVS